MSTEDSTKRPPNPMERRKTALSILGREATPNDKKELRALAVAIGCDDACRKAYLAYQFPLETELMSFVEAGFSLTDTSDDDCLLQQVHDLRLIRRFLLTRYAYGRVAAVDAKLKGHVSRAWLWKDYLIPRLGLSLALGFAVVCGGSAFYEWLGALAGVPAAAFAAAALSLGWFLIYLDVRQRITGAHPGLVLRTFWVFFVGLVWAVAQISAAAIFTSWIGWRFHWLHAAMVAGPALAVAVLTQFFFTKAGSIGEPL